MGLCREGAPKGNHITQRRCLLKQELLALLLLLQVRVWLPEIRQPPGQRTETNGGQGHSCCALDHDSRPAPHAGKRQTLPSTL